MELRIWGKTIMSVQKYLERVTKAIDSLIYKKALASGYVSIKNLTNQSAYSVSDSIINLSERKIDLINLNTICFNALKGIDKVSAKILILKDIDGLTSAEIASLLGISNRTYFRKVNIAYENLEEWLRENKFNEDYFEEKYKNEGWIMEAFYKNKEDSQKKDLIIDEDFVKSIIRNINKTVAVCQ